MRKIFFSFLLLWAGPLLAEPPRIHIKPIPFAPPQAERVVLKNGVVVYLMEDHELPILYLTLRLKSDPSFETVPNAFDMMEAVWRTGGTKTLSPAEFDRRTENMASDISVYVDLELASLSLTCLSKNSKPSMDMLWDLLFHPNFKEDRLALVKENQLDTIRRKNDTPGDIGRRAFRDVLYGPTHVYSEDPTPANVKKLNRPALFQAHELLVVPDGAILSVAGDFDKKTFIEDLEKRFASWKPTGRTIPPYDFSLHSPQEGRIFYVEKDFTQSRIIFGRVGPVRNGPDQFALRIADYILGSGGPSRLFSEVRSRQGLAYMVGSVLVERSGPGLVAVVCQTAAPATVAAIRAISGELDKFSARPPNPEELDIAKEASINSFLFNFDSPNDVVSIRSSTEFFNYPADYLETYTRRLGALTLQDIFRVGKKYYTSEGMKIVVVGNEKKFKDPLKSFGPVIQLPLDKLE